MAKRCMQASNSKMLSIKFLPAMHFCILWHRGLTKVQSLNLIRDKTSLMNVFESEIGLTLSGPYIHIPLGARVKAFFGRKTIYESSKCGKTSLSEPNKRARKANKTLRRWANKWATVGTRCKQMVIAWRFQPAEIHKGSKHTEGNTTRNQRETKQN